MVRRARLVAAAVLGAALAAAAACENENGGAATRRTLAATDAPAITVTWKVPTELQDSPSLAQAAAFAWQEFIALNWPAIAQNGAPGTRDSADTNAVFGDSSYTGPLVWHTFRAKVEIFPAPDSMPQGYTPSADSSYGYDAPPRYSYASAIGPFYPGQATDSVPWINLDENDEIGLDAMYAGVATGQPFPGDLILFMAKANRSEYTYVAGNRFFPTADRSGVVGAAFDSSASYVMKQSASPPPGGAAALSLPGGTIEIKAGWRRLTPAEVDSGRFYSTRVRFYRNSGGAVTYQDTVFGLVALHIIHKTPNHPYFVYATFEQADNLLDSLGNRVEDVDGNVNPGYASLPPFEPVITSANARAPAPDTGYTLQNIQHLSPATAASRPRSRVYFRNSAQDSTPQGVVSVNRRVHPIPPQVIEVNQAAHAAIAAYNQQHGIRSSPWQYYKLINVQYQPIAGKQPGMSYGGADSSNFYQANAVVETDYNLQTFSGMFQPNFTDPATGAEVDRKGTITDWCAQNAQSTPACTGNGPFYNVRFGGHAYNMGGCMGCHGNAQIAGTDFSFIMFGAQYGNRSVQVADPLSASSDGVEKFLQFFRRVARPSTRAAPAASPRPAPAPAR